MRTWLGPFCDACGAWAARTGLPEHLVAGPLLDYTGGYRREQTESSIDAMRAWFERLQRETGMHDHFLVFAAIKATESFLAVWVARLPEEHARAAARSYKPIRDRGPRRGAATAAIGARRLAGAGVANPFRHAVRRGDNGIGHGNVAGKSDSARLADQVRPLGHPILAATFRTQVLIAA